jgi:hypothetical protein
LPKDTDSKTAKQLKSLRIRKSRLVVEICRGLILCVCSASQQFIEKILS